jgi:hypothetical protein
MSLQGVFLILIGASSSTTVIVFAIQNTACVNTKTPVFCIHSVFMGFLRLFAQTAIVSLNSIDHFSSAWRTSVFSVRYELEPRILLSAFAKLRIATIDFVMSVRPHGITRLSMDGFS